MPPLNNENKDVLSARQEMQGALDNTEHWDPEASISSDLSIDLLAKDDGDRDSPPHADVDEWNPEGSDYSLDVLLARGRKDSSDLSSDDSLLGSDFSLNCTLVGKPGESNNSSISSLPECTPESQKEEPRHVNFHGRIRVKKIAHLKSMDEKLKRDVWYNRKEFKEIRRECVRTIALMKVTESLEAIGSGFCSRGLEYKKTNELKTRQQRRIEIRTLILDEQDAQVETGTKDPSWIASLSEYLSQPCVSAAIEAALQDAKDANEYLMS